MVHFRYRLITVSRGTRSCNNMAAALHITRFDNRESGKPFSSKENVMVLSRKIMLKAPIATRGKTHIIFGIVIPSSWKVRLQPT